MIRVTPDQLDAIAWEHRRLIEVDDERGIKVVVVRGVTYYATLPPVKSDAEGSA